SGPASPQVLPVAKTVDTAAEAQKLVKRQQITENREAAEIEAKRPKYVRPAAGSFTSGYGGRWGEMHYGIDIAGPIGTPILAAADGVVVEAGPASGFGLWVKVEHDDGTTTVYGHMDTFSVRKGQRVMAGEQIARMGNRGFSTGPHLHFEVWNP
ncbi:M23 family metallopeptidase, partial [Saccharothrix sp. MB29]|nr:M23 family metallopeptidase [Saccharothrix sp. MB29]